MEIARRAAKEILFDAADGWETQLNGTMLVGVKWQAMSNASRVAEGSELARGKELLDQISLTDEVNEEGGAPQAAEGVRTEIDMNAY